MTPTDKRIRLNELIVSEGCTVVPGCYDAISAIIAERAGFPALYVGSYSTSSGMLGLPDVCSVTLTEMVEVGRHIADATSVPLIGDMEAGFYHSANVWRTVREFEEAGFAGAHIEDHEFGKHTHLPPVITDAQTMCKRVQACCDARLDKNFVILARTDTMWITGDIEDFVRRSNMYLDAGADAIYVANTTQLTREAIARVHGPVTGTYAPNMSVAQEAELGIKLSIYWPAMSYAALVGCKEVCEQFKRNGDYRDMGKYRFDETEFNKYIPFPEFLDRAKTYL
jgi:2-methylisocitrate lyase-like PEP mutase family enzyme